MLEIIASVHVTEPAPIRPAAPIMNFASPFRFPRRTPNVNNLTPQSRVVLNHLKAAGSITAVEASAVHRVRSLSRRITEISSEGFKIKKEQKKDVNGQRYVRYSLEA